MSRTLRRISLAKLALPVKARRISPYIDSSLYDKYVKAIFKYRIRPDAKDYYILFNRQGGLCEFCNLALMVRDEGSVDLMDYIDNIDSSYQNTNKLVIHYIKSLTINGLGKGLSNKTLLHENCYKLLYNKTSELPYRKF